MEFGNGEFDENFESMPLRKLAKQFPEFVESAGEVTFFADEEGRLSGARWSMESALYAQANKLGFKLLLMELLDALIRYRAQCNQLSRKKGIVCFGGGAISIEWLPDEGL